MNYDEIIDFLIQEVKMRIENENKKTELEKKDVLVVINGGNNGLSQVVVELEKMSEVYNLEAIYSQQSKKISEDKISDIIKTNLELSYHNAKEILKDKDIIVLPLLTKSLAAKIAYGIRDTEIAYLISNAILENKTIIAAYDSCRLEGNSEYINQINLNIDKLKRYGIKFTEAKYLADTVKKIVEKKILYMNDKSAISTRDISNLYDTDVVIGKETKITNLVYDKAKENGIKFIRE